MSATPITELPTTVSHVTTASDHTAAVIANIVGLFALIFSWTAAADHYLRPVATVLAVIASGLTIVVHTRNLMRKTTE